MMRQCSPIRGLRSRPHQMVRGCAWGALASPYDVVSVVGPRHVVHVRRDVEQQLLVRIGIDHGAVPQRALQPDAHGAVHVFAGPSSRTFMFVQAVDEDPHMHLVLVLVHHDLAHPAVVTAERDPELKLAVVTLPEPERVAELLRLPIRARGPL